MKKEKGRGDVLRRRHICRSGFKDRALRYAPGRPVNLRVADGEVEAVHSLRAHRWAPQAVRSPTGALSETSGFAASNRDRSGLRAEGRDGATGQRARDTVCVVGGAGGSDLFPCGLHCHSGVPVLHQAVVDPRVAVCLNLQDRGNIRPSKTSSKGLRQRDAMISGIGHSFLIRT